MQIDSCGRQYKLLIKTFLLLTAFQWMKEILYCAFHGSIENIHRTVPSLPLTSAMFNVQREILMLPVTFTSF